METPQVRETIKETIYGSTLKFTLPSGYEVTIREQNGNDDDILSNTVTAQDLSNIDIFIAGIVIATNLPFAKNNKLTMEAVTNLALKDKYAIIFRSRVHSLGKEINFKYKWEDSKEPDTYTEDLSLYLWDYKEEMPVKGTPEYFEYRLQPYTTDCYKDINFITSSGKEVMFNILNGKGEKFLLQIPIEQQTKNVELRARNLRLKTANGFEKVDNFAMFSPKDLREIRAEVSKVDAPFLGISEVTNPRTKEVAKFPILQLKDFFYPEEI